MPELDTGGFGGEDRFESMLVNDLEQQPEKKEEAAPIPDSADKSSSNPECGAGNREQRRLSEDLAGLVDTFEHRAVALREVFEALHGRGFDMLLILLTLPFCTPIPLPGVSTVLGILVAFIGLRLSLGQKPWLPARMLEHRLPPLFFPKLFKAARHLVRFLEWLLKPRLVRAMRWPPIRHLLGGMIFVSALFLMLPFPIPLSNFIPAFTVLLIASAQMEEDGIAAILGGIFFLLTLVYFGILAWGGTEMIYWIQAKLAARASEILP